MQILSSIGTTTQLTPSQQLTYGPKPIRGYGAGAMLTVTVRFDDRCGNGHNTFSISSDVTTPESRARRDSVASGSPAEIAALFPELGQALKWSGCSTDGPMHYVENTLYWLGRRGNTRWHNDIAGRPSMPNDPPNLNHARKTAIWPDMPEGFVITGTLVSNASVKAALMDRLPGMLAEFRAAIEALGLVW